MDQQGMISVDCEKYAISLTIAMTVEELAETMKIDTSKILSEFMKSKTGSLLFDMT